MKTSMRIDARNRDVLARIAERDYGGATLDEAIARLAWEHDAWLALRRMTDEQRHDYQAEAASLAETDVEVTD